MFYPQEQALKLSFKNREDSKTSVIKRYSCKMQKVELQTACFETYIHSSCFGWRYPGVRGGSLEKSVHQRKTCAYQAAIQWIPHRDLKQETFRNLPLPVGELDLQLIIAILLLCSWD